MAQITANIHDSQGSGISAIPFPVNRSRSGIDRKNRHVLASYNGCFLSFYTLYTLFSYFTFLSDTHAHTLTFLRDQKGRSQATPPLSPDLHILLSGLATTV